MFRAFWKVRGPARESCEQLQRKVSRARPWHEERGFPRIKRQPWCIRHRPSCRAGKSLEKVPEEQPRPPCRTEAAQATPSASLQQLRSMAQDCFKSCLSVQGGFRAGPMAVDCDRHRLLVACDDHLLVQPLMERQGKAERLDLGPRLGIRVELGGEQDVEFAVEGQEGKAGPWAPADLVERHRVATGWTCGIWMWSPMNEQENTSMNEQENTPKYFAPDDMEQLFRRLRNLPDGWPVLFAGRVFGDPVDTWNAYPGLEVAGAWESSGVGDPGQFIRFDDPGGCIVKYATMSWIKTVATKAASPQFHRFVETVGHHRFEGAAHGDVFALLTIKGQPSKSAGLIIPAAVAKHGLRQAQSRGVATKLLSEWCRPLGEQITSLATSGSMVLIATKNRVLQLCNKNGDLQSLRGPEDGAGTRGMMAVDWQRRVIYRASSGLQAFDFEGTMFRPVELPNCDLSTAKSVSLHRNWLLVCHPSGVVVIDLWKGLHLNVATCDGAVNASIIKDRIGIVTDRGIALSAWSVQEIDRYLHRLQEGEAPPRPPTAIPWLGSAMKGLSIPGFPAASTPLDRITAAVQHHGEVFVAHGGGVFSLSLPQAPALIGEEPELEEERWSADFRTVYDGEKLALIMSPVIPWGKGELFKVRIALQNNGAFICGLAPEEECFANASVLPAEVCAKQPRVDGILVHETNPWDDRTCARRLYEFMPSAEGKWEWSKGIDLLSALLDWRKARNDEDDGSGRTFFLGNRDGVFVLELQAVAKQTDRGGVQYFLQKATLSAPHAESPAINLINKPLESFEMGQGRRVRFYVCALPPASTADEEALRHPQEAIVHREAASLVLAKDCLPSMALVGGESES